jgi:streptogramin lyase
LAGLSLREQVRPAVHLSLGPPLTVLTRTDLAGWGPPTALAAVPGGVWLASWDEGELVRVDAATGRIAARVHVGEPMRGPYSIAYGAGSLWVTDYQTGDLLRLNPETGLLVATLPIGARYVTVGGGFVWITSFEHVSGPNWNSLVKIDPVTDRVLGDVLVPGNYGPGGMLVAATGGAVWLHIDGAPFVQAVDPATMRVTARARTGDVWGLVPVGHQAWVLAGDRQLDRIDPPWSAVSGSVQLPEPLSGPTPDLVRDIAAGPDGTVWVGGRALYQIGPGSLRVRTIRGFGAVDDVATLGATLWVQAGNGSVYQVALHRPGTSSAVPDVVMLPLAAADRLLERDGYPVNVVREVGLEPLGRVIYQDPSAGTLVPRGTMVTLVISAGPATQNSSP